jgi:hypothetical protein
MVSTIFLTSFCQCLEIEHFAYWASPSWQQIMMKRERWEGPSLKANRLVSMYSFTAVNRSRPWLIASNGSEVIVVQKVQHLLALLDTYILVVGPLTSHELLSTRSI